MEREGNGGGGGETALRAHAVWHACWFVGILNDHLGVARRDAVKTWTCMRCQLKEGWPSVVRNDSRHNRNVGN
jgi:hypothetical protein